MPLKLDYANKLLGTELKASEVKKLLEKMRYGVEVKGDVLEVMVPAYRTDVLHAFDLVEDVAIAYGYMNFKPEEIRVHTTAAKNPLEDFSSKIRTIMVGGGFQEIMSLVMTNPQDLFDRMNVNREIVTEAENPVSAEHSVCRTWIIPSLINFLSKNKNQEYPQKIFEIGDCIKPDGKNVRHIAAAVAHSKTNFSEMKAVLEGVLKTLGADYPITNFAHNSFIPGRCASVGVGFFGEFSPKVLHDFGLEVPVTAFELDADKILNLTSKK